MALSLRSPITAGAMAALAAFGVRAMALPPLASAEGMDSSVEVPIHAVTTDGTGPRLGSLRFTQGHRGLIVTADVRGLKPGRNSMHIHEVRSCGPAMENGELVPGAAAGPHWDPTGVMNVGVMNNGHGSHAHHEEQGGAGSPLTLPLGDLPDLIADADGISRSMVTATRLGSLTQILGRSVVIHRGPDGPKFACGLLPL